MTTILTRLAGAGAMACGLAAGAASAATVTFDFTKASTKAQPSLSYAAGDLSLTVTGWDDQGGTRRVQTWAGAGLGVNVVNDSSHALDSYGPDDIAVLAFSKAVTITSISFSYITKGSAFDIWADVGGTATRVVNDAAVAPIVSSGLDLVASSLFGIEAEALFSRSCKQTSKGQNCTTTEHLSQFKLAGLTVSYDDPPAPVPLPAAGVLLAGGLGALGLARRRGRATA